MAIRYRSWERSHSREVEPLGVVLKGGAWYLVARSVDSTKSSKTKNAKAKMATAKIATYRIANILTFESLGPTFKRPKDFDLTAYWRESLARFEADLARSRAWR
ncbi:MAG: WYL domain-containing protein [Lysobacter sp.]|nr:WYL domain-containing protein [Lysobacter sp.]